jgi:hypothetical protein
MPAGSFAICLCHLSWNLKLYELLTCLIGYGIACRNTILDVEFDCFTDICHHFLPGGSLRYATRQSRDKRYIMPVRFLFENHGVAHLLFTISFVA